MKPNLRTTLFLAIVIFITNQNFAISQMATFDAAQFTQMIKDFNQAVKSLNVLSETRDQLEDMGEAIGELGRLTLPYTNMQNIKSQLKKDAQCLIPNFDEIFGIEFKDFEFTICDRQFGYSQGLAIHPDEIVNLKAQQINELQDEIRVARENILYEAATKAMAQYDIGVKKTEELNKLADDIERNTQLCQDLKCLQGQTVQAQTGILRTLIQDNLIQLQKLRVQSAFAVVGGVAPMVEASAKADE